MGRNIVEKGRNSEKLREKRAKNVEKIVEKGQKVGRKS